MAGGGFGDAGVVRGGRERDVEVGVAGFRAEAVGVDKEEGTTGGVPACERGARLILGGWRWACGGEMGRIGVGVGDGL